MSDDTKRDKMVIACNLSAAEMAARERELADSVFSQAEQVEELADGYALRFPGSDEWANRLLQFITFERACCPFFSFELGFEPNQGPIWLRIHGPEGVKEVIAEMLR